MLQEGARGQCCEREGRAGRRGADLRGEGAEGLVGQRSGEAEADVGVADARIEVVAKSCPHEPGVVVPGAAAINPVRACRLFPG